MRRLVFALVLSGLSFALPAGAANPEASPSQNPCAFDPQHIVLNDAVKLYFCVPIADALCALHCGPGATSVNLNTTVANGRLGKTSLDCAAPAAHKETARDIRVDGLTDPLRLACKPPAP